MDIVDRLRENADLDAAEHVPAEVVQMQYDAADELARLREQVAALTKERDSALALFHSQEDESVTERNLRLAAQAREEKLFGILKALRGCVDENHCLGSYSTLHAVDKLLALPADDSALQAALAAERERCAELVVSRPWDFPSDIAAAIRNLT